MKKTLQLSAAALTSLVLCACGGGTDNSNSSTSSSPATSSSTSESSSSMSPSSMSSSSNSSASSSSSSATTSSSSVQAAALDAQSVTWFSTFCTGLSGVGSSFSSIQTELGAANGGTPQEKQAAVVAAVTTVGNTFKELATKVGTTPAPTSEGGSEIAATAVTGFNALGDSVIAAATTFGQAPADEAALQAAAQTMQTDLQGAFTQAQTSFDALDADSSPEMDKAITDIPECGFLKK